MPRGRRAEPAAIKRAKGNPGRRKIAEPAQLGIEAGSIASAPPADMGADQVAIWSRIVPDLERMNLLKPTDVSAFHRYCVFLSKFFEAEKALRDLPLVVETVSEHVTMERRSKWLDSMLLLDRRLIEMEDRFGMNPAARQRIFLQLAASQSQPSLPGMAQPAKPDAPRHPADASSEAGGMQAAMGSGGSPVGLLGRLN